MPNTAPPEPTYDVVVVGAGFAGLYTLHSLRQRGVSVRLFEAGDGVGGTWYWNRYPGARCDVDSADYSYSFDDALQQDWEWAERFPAQPEILRYLEHVADRFGLREDITFGTRVTSAHFDETSGLWTIGTDRGGHTDIVTARWTVMATGPLSAARLPDIDGRDSFAGEVHHTAHWPANGVDFTGKRVGVIGTGSSGVQAIPLIADEAAELTVFQRTAGFVIPARNRPLGPGELAEIKADYPARRQLQRESHGGWILPAPVGLALETAPEVRDKEYETRWAAGGLAFQTTFGDIMMDATANETAAEFVRSKIRETVTDPATAEALCPQGYPLGTKRVCIGTDYYETYNRGNVDLVDLGATPIERIVPEGIRTGTGLHELDMIVYATGFDAMTGALGAIDIRGRGGVTLSGTWEAGPRTYLGVAVAGFPNLFVLAGPGSPSVLSNVVVSIEQHVEWVVGYLDHMRSTGARFAEATAAAQDQWVEHVTTIAEPSLYMRADSWYLGANVPGKPRIFMPYLGGVGTYRSLCAQIAADGYRGFTTTAELA
ncbi:flavin-containing monooxygenase [Prescottella agglutinans]|uniref:Cation diffusion facilitator CzcD-associated flavoprotein CzcO n=1 Tax=Prescottella agglutinans TaxID=1644129 RepID=A0ABT6M7L3_9NOCA|nr:NAD(P)/FAD-dependent oxidoreductase [Prescottella agglutinans]MDH6280268.1 cation diffusion facilitator CzcD-associated flavoprotein CzcO [Prescottella agglutinans]